ncbi:uncharacterized protein G2W53_029355 [Senna tora]|uniref:Uncharacterized protein n=1 Tax=Senna tora TaxID=362788 RepID=A0A834T767_9FABA|nr:uncharacterized protein G2W53_029355 [Senna tora]
MRDGASTRRKIKRRTAFEYNAARLSISTMSSSTCTNYNNAKAKSAKWKPIQFTFFTNVQDILIPQILHYQYHENP